ncbi:MAG: hypothetical protein OES24_06720 [Acidimicrobiia bacterium]|nr:hypothetical protein [Acidimicrobiia bacterium]
MVGQPILLGFKQPPSQPRLHQTSGPGDDHVNDRDNDTILGRYPIDGFEFDVDVRLDDGDDRVHNLDIGVEFDIGLHGGIAVERRLDLVDHRHGLMSAGPRPSILFLCTGNASRSVMGAAALARRRPELTIVTAGTLAVEGLPMSTRTRQALLDAALEPSDHRSRQATRPMLAESTLVIAAAPEHVAWVRREHPDHVERTATLIHLVRSLSTAMSPLGDRVRELDLGEHRPRPDEEIVDPGGGELELYVEVAHQIVSLVDKLADRL